MIALETTELFQTVRQDCPGSDEITSLAEMLNDRMKRGVIFLDQRGIIAYINRYAAKVLQVRKETVIGKRVDMLPLRTPLYKVLSEQCRDTPLEMVVKGRVIAVQSTEICSADGELQGDITELWDVTEERRAQRQWEECVAMLTHDLRAPLTLIMGHVQGMQCGMYGELGSRLRAVVAEVAQSGALLNAMIEEMLDTYRLEVGPLNLNRRCCDMARILQICYQDNLRAAQEQGVTLTLVETEALPELTVDSKRFIRVFNNLIGNAIKFTSAGGEVSIGAEISDDAFQVVVADTGIGIPPEDLSRIFYKYYRSAGASGFKGTGLGLAIGKAIVEAHGGTIEVESTVGMGSRFRVTIPLTAS